NSDPMAQFDVYRLKALNGYGVDIQHAHLDQLPSRLMLPLLPPAAFAGGINRLNPLVEVNGESFVIKTEFATAIGVRELGKPVANLSDHRDQIIAAMDMLVTGI
ncbi:MAG: CcdB family protein, partial [Anderseniella sp.]|nr:CcdB family protein [Anderseniella sp.]